MSQSTRSTIRALASIHQIRAHLRRISDEAGSASVCKVDIYTIQDERHDGIDGRYEVLLTSSYFPCAFSLLILQLQHSSHRHSSSCRLRPPLLPLPPSCLPQGWPRPAEPTLLVELYARPSLFPKVARSCRLSSLQRRLSLPYMTTKGGVHRGQGREEGVR